ncbi:L,D-transpeptidase family protein [Fluviicola sp.]|uniref:L,D-transpeptidase family protein n=1 Tax=Fluviicola sp. TaxID=1917219 RepID=UPI00283AAF79|nr:L,D-transpeptidase family protein [Fluviicola sp.]
MAVESDLLATLQIPEGLRDSVYAFYKVRDFRPVWANDSVLTQKGMIWKELLEYPCALGLPDNRPFTYKEDSLSSSSIIQEFVLTARLAQLQQDLKVGFLDTAANHYRPVTSIDLKTLSKSIWQMDTVKNWGHWFAQMGPARPEYRALATALFNYAYHKKLSAIHFEVPALVEDSLRSLELAEESLIDKGYLDAKKTDSASFWEAMGHFQADNGLKADGVIGIYTRKALDESERYKCHRAILSLERWRWRTPFPERYLWVNIPEYKLRIFYNDTLFSEHRVVVGKPENQTPELSSRLRAIVSMPFWTQPHSIASKEFLPAIQRNSGYAAKNHYKVYRGETEVDPATIDWKRYKEKNFPFRVRQEPGNDNALGLIKFEFNNKFGVYIHDTPSKGFFSKDIRAYSHGCVRCQMPDSLARFILSRDGRQKMTRDSLDTLIARKEHRSIVLNKPIPIQLDYITVVTSENGKLVFFPDVYDRDEKYLKMIKIYPNN